MQLESTLPQSAQLSSPLSQWPFFVEPVELAVLKNEKKRAIPISEMPLTEKEVRQLNKTKAALALSGSLELAVTRDQIFHRKWVKIFLRPEDAPVHAITDQWREERKISEKLSKSVYLTNAIERGDIDTVLKIHPLLGEAILAKRASEGWTILPPGKEPKVPKEPESKKSDPLLNSDSLKEESKREKKEEEGNLIAPIVKTLADVTGVDPILAGRYVRPLAKLMLKAGYNAEDLLHWHKHYWVVDDWRGQKHERPTLRLVQETLGLLRAEPRYRRETTEPVVETYAEPENAEAFEEEVYEPVRHSVREVALVLREAWEQAMREYKFQVNASTYDSWFKNLRLLEAVKRDKLRWVVEAPHEYSQDWIERNALYIIREKLYNYIRSISYGDIIGIKPELIQVFLIITEDEWPPYDDVPQVQADGVNQVIDSVAITGAIGAVTTDAAAIEAGPIEAVPIDKEASYRKMAGPNQAVRMAALEMRRKMMNRRKQPGTGAGSVPKDGEAPEDRQV